MNTRLLKPEDVDAMLRYPPGKAKQLARKGLIPFIRLPDGALRFSEQTIAGLMREQHHILRWAEEVHHG